MDNKSELMSGHVDNKMSELRMFQEGAMIGCPGIDSNYGKLGLLRTYLLLRDEAFPVSILLSSDEYQRRARRLFVSIDGIEEMSVEKD